MQDRKPAIANGLNDQIRGKGMQRVLLAIDGLTFNHRVFHIALELCRTMRAELGILQIIKPDRLKGCFKRMKEKTKEAMAYVEGSMMAIAFAEAGDHETAAELMEEALKKLYQSLPETAQAGIKCDVYLRTGNPEQEIIGYLKNHREVVLAIYDRDYPFGKKTKGNEKAAPPGSVREFSPIPWVVVHS